MLTLPTLCIMGKLLCIRLKKTISIRNKYHRTRTFNSQIQLKQEMVWAYQKGRLLRFPLDKNTLLHTSFYELAFTNLTVDYAFVKENGKSKNCRSVSTDKIKRFF